jgi:hypothetical protein
VCDGACCATRATGADSSNTAKAQILPLIYQSILTILSKTYACFVGLPYLIISVLKQKP